MSAAALMRKIETLIIRFETLAIVVALGFYIWFLRRFGLGQIVEYLRLAAWGLSLTVALEAVARAANTLGWWVTIANRPRSLRFPSCSRRESRAKPSTTLRRPRNWAGSP